MIRWSYSGFNSRPCERGNARAGTNLGRRCRFQFTPLREGQPTERVNRDSDQKFQFTPLREGQQEKLYPHCFGVFVSIHAPARGATFVLLESGVPAQFQFTPLREGQQSVELAGRFLDRFQFTPLREGQLARHVFVPA